MKTAGLVTVVLLAIVFLGGGAYAVLRVSDSQSLKTRSSAVKCDSPGAKQYIVSIQRNKVLPSHTNAALCGRLTIVNRDDRSRLIAFGVHDSHRPYDGVEERVLSKDQQMTVTLNQSGDFMFHDHFDDAVKGTFTVR